MNKKLIIYSLVIIVVLMLLINNEKNERKYEEFMTIDLSKGGIMDIDVENKTNLKTGQECKYPSECVSNECVKDPSNKMLCM